MTRKESCHLKLIQVISKLLKAFFQCHEIGGELGRRMSVRLHESLFV